VKSRRQREYKHLKKRLDAIESLLQQIATAVGIDSALEAEAQKLNKAAGTLTGAVDTAQSAGSATPSP
jgi:hypothetical protein